jgi:hypothetical protein
MNVKNTLPARLVKLGKLSEKGNGEVSMFSFVNHVKDTTQ